MLTRQSKVILTGESCLSPKFTYDKHVSIEITSTLHKSMGGMDVVSPFNAKKAKKENDWHMKFVWV